MRRTHSLRYSSWIPPPPAPAWIAAAVTAATHVWLLYRIMRNTLQCFCPLKNSKAKAPLSRDAIALHWVRIIIISVAPGGLEWSGLELAQNEQRDVLY